MDILTTLYKVLLEATSILPLPREGRQTFGGVCSGSEYVTGIQRKGNITPHQMV
jgi:hypothetical protein